MIKKVKRGKLTPHSSSIVLHLAPILVARNILQPYVFLRKIGIANGSAQKMLHGKAVQINFRQLTQLCLHLNCTPNDLLATRQMSDIGTGHQLHTLQTTDAVGISPYINYANMSLTEIKELGKNNG